MKNSYEGIGQWAATFACSDIAEGQVVKISGNGEVAPCADGDKFCGVVISVGRDGKAKCRPFMFCCEYEGKLWFCTNNTKDVYKDMQENPQVRFFPGGKCGILSKASKGG